jgi:hypothetical protein
LASGGRRLAFDTLTGMLGWRKLLIVAAVDAVLFSVSGVVAESTRHFGTISNVLWMDFLIGVLLFMVLAAANALRSALTLRH